MYILRVVAGWTDRWMVKWVDGVLRELMNLNKQISGGPTDFGDALVQCYRPKLVYFIAMGITYLVFYLNKFMNISDSWTIY